MDLNSDIDGHLEMLREQSVRNIGDVKAIF